MYGFISKRKQNYNLPIWRRKRLLCSSTTLELLAVRWGVGVTVVAVVDVELEIISAALRSSSATFELGLF